MVECLVALIVGLILLIISWGAPKLWLKIMGPIDYLNIDMAKWSEEDDYRRGLRFGKARLGH